jgi:hypothetical protein
VGRVVILLLKLTHEAETQACMYILYLFKAVFIAHDISLEKKGLECEQATHSTEAKFLVADRGDTVDFNIGLWLVVMATISKRRWNEASILTSFPILKRNEPAYSRTCKDRSEANPAPSAP